MNENLMFSIKLFGKLTNLLKNVSDGYKAIDDFYLFMKVRVS